MCKSWVYQVRTCLHAIEGDVFALGLVTLCNDGWDPVQPNMISSAAATSIVIGCGDLLLAASFAVFGHDGRLKLVVGEAFDSGVRRNELWSDYCSQD
jgi:hypothetical protein